MDERSHVLGNGQSSCNGNSSYNGPVPFYLRSPAYVDARAVSTTFWDLL